MSARRSPVITLSLACFAAALAISVTTSATLAAAPAYTLFESGQVRPLALSPNGQLLFAVNTPDSRLEIFRVHDSGLTHLSSVPVGLEPVAVAARSNDEVWVVNHLSDSVSVVEVTHSRRPTVIRTLLVGDEPRDIVFAGPSRTRAFITTAHRGQHAVLDPQLTTPGVGRADVWVFEATQVDASLGGTPLTVVTLFSDTPRALAVTPDGTKVYVAAFHSGNQTTAVEDTIVPNGGEEAGGVPGPNVNFEGIVQPEVAVLVQYDGAHWRDVLGRSWNDAVKFALPDKDIFIIDAMATPPSLVPGPAGFFAHVGTVLYNMVVNPVSGTIYVSNTESFNLRRFEGPGLFAGETLRGRFHEDRITIVRPNGVFPRHLNKHIDFSACCAPVPNAENAKSLALPQGMAVSADGATLYVAALGSSKIGVLSTQALEHNTFVPSTRTQIPVSGGGPTGLVLDPEHQRLYVMTRFDNGISIINTTTRTEIAHLTMHTPEPPAVVTGRRFLYDASFTSSHGDSACATCHVFGDFDSLAWDLGNPDAAIITNPGPFARPNLPFLLPTPDFFPLKGPMTTQSLRGMANHGPMHWRGDRTGGNDEPSTQPEAGTFDEDAAFKKFQAGFVDLLGRSGPLPDAAMQAFTDFILRLTYPPNPIRNLDNSLTPDQQVGRAFFFGPISDTTNRCGDCHVLDPGANPTSLAPGFFGSTGLSSFKFLPQMFKVPHLRNLYQKIGMFGMAEALDVEPGNNGFQGDQVRGFGFQHDGVFDTLFRFHHVLGFTANADNPGGFPPGVPGELLRRQVEAFLLAFDSNMAPIVGQQVTLTTRNAAAAHGRIDLLIARAEADECDLVAKTRVGPAERGFLYVGGGSFIADRQAVPPVPDALLRQVSLLFQREVTYTCTPPGSGMRMGIDRDGDGHRDGDEAEAGSNPADPASTP